MKLSAARLLPNAETLRSAVSRIAWGEDARAFSPTSRVLLLPHAARTDVPGGQTYIHWQPSRVVAPGTEVKWAIKDRGVDASGTARIGPTGTLRGDWPDAAAPIASTAQAAVADGELALWQLLPQFERYVANSLERANTFVAADIDGSEGAEQESWAPTDNRGVLDSVALERLCAELVYGNTPTARKPTIKVTYFGGDAEVAAAMSALADIENGDRKASPQEIARLSAIANRGLQHKAEVTEVTPDSDDSEKQTSVLIRMIRLAALTPINRQPLGPWFATNIPARAEELIRRTIGDPHIGRKVRRVMRAYNPASLDELLEIYRRTHPEDGAGRDRLLAAISAGKTVDATSTSTALFVNLPESGVVA